VDGRSLGYAIGWISVSHFEEAFREIASRAGCAIALVRSDGVTLARSPDAPPTADATPDDGSLSESADRVTVEYRVEPYQLAVVLTQESFQALSGWRSTVWVVALITAGGFAWLAVAGLAASRWWRRLRTLAAERAIQADAAQARVSAEADLARERERDAEAASRVKSGFLAAMSHLICAVDPKSATCEKAAPRSRGRDLETRWHTQWITIWKPA
jgi:signal transduction histidine kinase